jgi:hypothetical protein
VQCVSDVARRKKKRTRENIFWKIVLILLFSLNCVVAARTKKKSPGYISKSSNEPASVQNKRERNKINSLARVLQLEHALYQDDTVLRFAALNNRLNHVDKQIDNLRLDMQAAIHNEFMYLVNKMMLLPSKQQQHHCDNSTEIDVGVRR